MRRISLTVNGRAVSATVEPRVHLADFLREELFLTGTHTGCEHGVCGACTVTLDGEIVRSCITYAAQCDGAEVATIEGYDDDPLMARLRAAFTADHALQCGYCTPGMLITARDLVRRLGDADEKQIRRELSGNLCRCTGYMGIVTAIRRVMDERPDLSDITPTNATIGPAPGAAAARTAEQPGEEHSVAAAETAETAARPRRDSPDEVSDAGFTNLTQHFTIDHPPGTVWTFMGEIRQVAGCMPGAVVTAIEDDRVEGEIRVKLGPISAAFIGEGRITRDNAERQATIVGHGSDNRSASRARGRIVYRVAEAEGGGTRVDVEIGYALAGALAQFGRASIVEGLAARLTADFAENLANRLSGKGPEQGTETAPVNAGGLIRSVLWARIKAIASRLFGRAAQPPR